jgi:hypothetical protein
VRMRMQPGGRVSDSAIGSDGESTSELTLGRLRNDSHVEESLRGVVKVMYTSTARSNDIHNAE